MIVKKKRKCNGTDAMGLACRKRVRETSLWCAEHDPQTNPMLETKEWVPVLFESEDWSLLQRLWLGWVKRHVGQLRSFQELSEEQSARLVRDLKYPSVELMQRQLVAAAIDDCAYILVRERDLATTTARSRLLSSCVHELVHLHAPAGTHAHLEEALCVLAELALERLWLTRCDVEKCIVRGRTMHGRAGAAEAPQSVTALLALARKVTASEAVPPLFAHMETVEDTLERLQSPLRLAATTHERFMANKMERLAFVNEGGVPGPLGGDELLLLLREEKVDFAGLVRVRSEEDGAAYVGSLVSSVRGQGTGRRCLKHLQDFCRERGAHTLRLHSEDRADLQAIYSALGFARIAGVRNYYAEGRHALLWERAV